MRIVASALIAIALLIGPAPEPAAAKSRPAPCASIGAKGSPVCQLLGRYRPGDGRILRGQLLARARSTTSALTLSGKVQFVRNAPAGSTAPAPIDLSLRAFATGARIEGCRFSGDSSALLERAAVSFVRGDSEEDPDLLTDEWVARARFGKVSLAESASFRSILAGAAAGTNEIYALAGSPTVADDGSVSYELCAKVRILGLRTAR